jgi:hypothetical protein
LTRRIQMDEYALCTREACVDQCDSKVAPRPCQSDIIVAVRDPTWNMSPAATADLQSPEVASRATIARHAIISEPCSACPWMSLSRVQAPSCQSGENVEEANCLQHVLSAKETALKPVKTTGSWEVAVPCATARGHFTSVALQAGNTTSGLVHRGGTHRNLPKCPRQVPGNGPGPGSARV